MGKGGCTANDGGVAINPSTINNSNDTSTTTTTSTTTLAMTKITPSVLASKTSITECWIAYEGIVYDVTHWLSKHPGGIRTIMACGGQDATSAMQSMHKPETLLTSMKRVRKVGIFVPEDDDEVVAVAGQQQLQDQDQEDEQKKRLRLLQQAQKLRNDMINKDFLELNQKFENDGWYNAMPFHYWAAILRVIILFFGGVALVLNSQTYNTSSNIDTTSTDTITMAPSLSTMFLYYSQLMIGSIMLGLFFQNIAFMGHDAGHGSISASFSIDLWMGLILGNLLTGIDVSWWKSTHYVHHSATNSVQDDPDIQHMPLLCFEERMAENPWSTYHGRFMALDAIGRMCVPYQAWYFYPVMAVARINLYVQSMIYLIQTCPFTGRGDSKSTAGQSVMVNSNTGEIKEKYAWPKPSSTLWISSVLTLSMFWTAMVQFMMCLDFYSAVISFTVTHIAAGLLHVQILCSHVAMHYCTDGSGFIGASTNSIRGKTPVVSQDDADDKDDTTTAAIVAAAAEASTSTSTEKGVGGVVPPPSVGFFEWQALSTMDIACPPYMDWFHGGLQFQLEHHLFPRAPRWRLRQIMPLVDEIFEKYDIPVTRVPFIEANRMILTRMSDVGATLGKRISKEKNV